MIVLYIILLCIIMFSTTKYTVLYYTASRTPEGAISEDGTAFLICPVHILLTDMYDNSKLLYISAIQRCWRGGVVPLCGRPRLYYYRERERRMEWPPTQTTGSYYRLTIIIYYKYIFIFIILCGLHKQIHRRRYTVFSRIYYGMTRNIAVTQ